MKPKDIETFPNGWYVTFNKTTSHDTPWEVSLYNDSDRRVDKIRCDSYSAALAWRKSMVRIAKNGGRS